MAQPPVLYFAVVGAGDRPIFEADLTRKGSDGASAKEERPQYLYHFVLHASLDAVEDAEWATNGMHLGAVDRFNSLVVSAHTTATRTRFLLLHDGRPDDVVKAFFRQVHEAYVRAATNPFFSPSADIESPGFTRRVRSAARTFLR